MKKNNNLARTWIISVRLAPHEMKIMKPVSEERAVTVSQLMREALEIADVLPAGEQFVL